PPRRGPPAPRPGAPSRCPGPRTASHSQPLLASAGGVPPSRAARRFRMRPGEVIARAHAPDTSAPTAKPLREPTPIMGAAPSKVIIARASLLLLIATY